jgi:hypothetical protein
MHRRAGKGISLRCWEGQTNAGWNRDSGLEIKHDPCWGMVARVFLPTLNPALDRRSAETERLLARWVRLHAVRSILSTLALLPFLWLAVFTKSA